MPDQIHKPRLTLAIAAYHESPIEKPFQGGRPFTRWLSSAEQRWERILTIGEEWKQLEVGWIERAALLVLVNEPDVWQVQPTAEQRVESAAKIIEVGYLSPGNGTLTPEAAFLVHPGQTLPATPVSAKSLWLRCQKGQTRVTLTLIPE